MHQFPGLLLLELGLLDHTVAYVEQLSVGTFNAYYANIHPGISMAGSWTLDLGCLTGDFGIIITLTGYWTEWCQSDLSCSRFQPLLGISGADQGLCLINDSAQYGLIMGSLPACLGEQQLCKESSRKCKETLRGSNVLNMADLTVDLVACPVCGNAYKQRGIKKHLNICCAKQEHHKRDTEFLAREKLRVATEILKGWAGQVSASSLPGVTVPINNIKCEYHPSSECITEVHHFHEYSLQAKVPIDYIINDKPWQPFHTRRNFEFASLTITQLLMKIAVDSLIELTYGAVGKDPSCGTLILQSYDEMMDIWKLAANKMPGIHLSRK
ncbi:hypothetical protein BDN71DRAFT_1431770 [Pleurotus eryngii]|uniref:C2H2-type domain-containing protein n=1 Tax=Pleurotus eryngii TaxID=5323 RepID=A0A9P5ZXB6_PLEER|nr:hypothetical protein BDN71DRAFT_1431770 [Pleurotus eryngii]